MRTEEAGSNPYHLQVVLVNTTSFGETSQVFAAKRRL